MIHLSYQLMSYKLELQLLLFYDEIKGFYSLVYKLKNNDFFLKSFFPTFYLIYFKFSLSTLDK